MQEARTAITSEMTYNLVGAIARIRSLDCGERRLDALSKILDEAGRTGNLPPVGLIGGPVRHQWRSSAWDSVVASQTATHFPPSSWRHRPVSTSAFNALTHMPRTRRRPGATSMPWWDLAGG